MKKIGIKCSEIQMAELLNISENFLNLIKNAAEQNDVFILDCESFGISDKQIDACSKKYEALLTKEVEKISPQIMTSALFSGNVPELPALPDTPKKPVGVKIIEDSACCPGILHAFGLSRQKPSVVEVDNNIHDAEEHKEFKPQRIKI